MTPGIISVTKEFKNINGGGNEFIDPLISIEKDEYDDILVAYTRGVTPGTGPNTGPFIKLYTYKNYCDFYKQNGVSTSLCYDCYSDQQIAASTVVNCMQVSTVRFFTYLVTHDATKTNDERHFYGILTLENFDFNTNLIPNLKTWLEANIILTPNLAAFTPTITFDSVPANRSPTGDKKISLPFKI